MLPERLLGLVSCAPADGVQNLVFEGLDHPQDPLSGSAPRMLSQEYLPEILLGDISPLKSRVRGTTTAAQFRT